MPPNLRRLILAATALLLFTGTFNGRFSQEVSASKPDALDRRVIHYQDSGHDLAVSIEHLAQQYGVRTGIDAECATTNQNISVDMVNATVADVLDAIVAKEPGYKWSEVDGVVNVEPQQNINSVLDVQVLDFHVRQADPLSLYRTIVSLPELKKWLADNHLVERTLLNIDVMFGKDGVKWQRASLSVRGATLRTIMNRLVISHGFSGWIVGRWGNKRQYLSFGIS